MKVLLTTVGMLITVLIAILGLFFSWQSLRIAEGVREDNRVVANLDLEPEIKFYTQFKTVYDRPPYFSISNEGPIEAVQVVIELISHRYNGGSFFSVYGTEERYKVEELKPLDVKSFEISKHFLEVNARLGKPLESNVIEARIFYRKKPDLELFAKRAFYFINPEGLWVSERNISLKSEYYSEIKEALLNKYKNLEYLGGNILHDVDLTVEVK